MLKIGVIGCGAIGAQICKAIDTGSISAQLVAIYDRSGEHGESLLRSLKNKPIMSLPAELISKADIVVECASQAAVRELGLSVLEEGKDLMIMSAGALMDQELLGQFIQVARKNDCRMYIPSGAIAGIDGLKSASMARIDRVVLSTVKSPGGLSGAPFIIENNIDPGSFHEKTLIFEGNAREAVRAFPANVNVAASLSLAGIGAEKTHVKIFVDPGALRNIHEITVIGEFGTFTSRIENIPSPDNPRTSLLAALSAIATLKKITEPLQLGT
ncbi:MAG: aspartate dehydrogenase [Candidatus Methanoperedenaceae archaeon]|nr:MAG: aspartate dehydrogenase [Candidatus Methanoperedenaceae archaeon]